MNRYIHIYDKKTEYLIKRIRINQFDLNAAKEILGIDDDDDDNDPYLFYDYMIEPRHIPKIYDIVGEFDFQFDNYDYSLSCS